MALSNCLRSAGLSILLLGCADPQFPDGDPGDAATPPVLEPSDSGRDAGSTGSVDGASVTDAAAVPSTWPTVPGWAADIIGRFGYRTRLFVQAGSVVAHSDSLGFAAISRALDGSLEMEVTSCEAVTSSSLASMRITYPELLPKRVYRLAFDGEIFRASLLKPVAAGFLHEAPERCRGKEGMRVEKDPSQVWIRTSYCSCPTNVDAVVSANDCRVRDSDGDGQAGFRLDGSGAASGVYGGAIAFKHDFVMGTRRADGSLLAFNDERSVHYQLTGGGTWDQNRACPALQNPTDFVRVAADDSCAALIGKRNTLFPNPLPEPPGRCF